MRKEEVIAHRLSPSRTTYVVAGAVAVTVLSGAGCRAEAVPLVLAGVPAGGEGEPSGAPVSGGAGAPGSAELCDASVSPSTADGPCTACGAWT